MMPKRVALTDSEQNFADVAKALKNAGKPKPSKPSLWFVGFMLALMVLCISLGIWQIKRLDEKQALIARVEERISSAAFPLPPVAEWAAFDAEIYDFRPVQLVGTYVPEETVLVFTNLANPNGARSGVGYWVVTPLQRTEGGTVFVNRGFVPEASKDLFSVADLTIAPRGVQTITGIARISENQNSFTPGPDTENRIEYVRSIPRLSALVSEDLAPVAPIYVNADATAPDAMPQGGETKIVFPNRHTEYAITWFSFAAIIVIMTGFWLWRRSRS